MEFTIGKVLYSVLKHVTIGYLMYSLIQHGRNRIPNGKTTLVVVFSTQFPDLVDKPLAYVGILGYGRLLAHSLFTASIVIAVVVFFSRRMNQPALGMAFGTGYLSHVLVDAHHALLTREGFMHTSFLFWPLISRYRISVTPPGLPLGESRLFAIIMICAFGVWIYDGSPVVSQIWSAYRTRDRPLYYFI